MAASVYVDNGSARYQSRVRAPFCFDLSAQDQQDTTARSISSGHGRKRKPGDEQSRLSQPVHHTSGTSIPLSVVCEVLMLKRMKHAHLLESASGKTLVAPHYHGSRQHQWGFRHVKCLCTHQPIQNWFPTFLQHPATIIREHWNNSLRMVAVCYRNIGFQLASMCKKKP